MHKQISNLFYHVRSISFLHLLFIGPALVFVASCSPKIQATGKASYYSDIFNGRTTANGEKFRQGKRTAAHPYLPFGSKVRVRNLKNNKTVRVRINDRGPFVEGRIIDLSKKAARKLDMLQDGVVEVRLRYKRPKA